MLRTTHAGLVAKHPSVFCPPFFPKAGGVSIAFSLDHLIIDHIDADTALAHWLARRLTLAGYHIWCRGLAPIAGSSLNDTIRELLNNRAFRYICVLSPHSIRDQELTTRRLLAHAVGMQRGHCIVLPAIAAQFDSTALDSGTRGLVGARFDLGWARGLKDIRDVVTVAECPRESEGAQKLAIQSYYPPAITLNEPEILVSNLFRVIQIPQAILRFRSAKPLEDDNGPTAGKWGFKKVTPTDFLSFQRPPADLCRELDIKDRGGAMWSLDPEFDGIKVEDLLKELIKKSIHAECRRRGLCFCPDRNLIYFPGGLLKSDNLKIKTLDGKPSHFSVLGERSFGSGERSTKFHYNIAPVFVPSNNLNSGFDIIVRIRVRITDTLGKPYTGRAVNARRKKLCKGWWNWEWLCRTMGVMQFLADDNERIEIGNSGVNCLIIEQVPRTWSAPVRLDESALGDAKSIIDEEVFPVGEDDEDDEHE